MKKNLIIQIINIVYFLLIVVISNSDFVYLGTRNVIIGLSLIGCLCSLFAIIVSIKLESKFKWLFLVINIVILLIYLYGIYFEIAIYNT